MKWYRRQFLWLLAWSRVRPRPRLPSSLLPKCSGSHAQPPELAQAKACRLAEPRMSSVVPKPPVSPSVSQIARLGLPSELPGSVHTGWLDPSPSPQKPFP